MGQGRLLRGPELEGEHSLGSKGGSSSQKLFQLCAVNDVSEGY